MKSFVYSYLIGNETMIIGLDNNDNFMWPVIHPWKAFTINIQGQEVCV
jgi:hypothetical protein